MVAPFFVCAWLFSFAWWSSGLLASLCVFLYEGRSPDLKFENISNYSLTDSPIIPLLTIISSSNM